MTNKKKLTAYIQTIYNVSVKTAIEIADDFEPVIFPKNRLLIEEQRLNRHFYFLEEGYVRSFVKDAGGMEVTTNLFSPPCFINDFTAFQDQQPATENFETLCECSGWVMSYDQVLYRMHMSQEFREFYRLVILRSYGRIREHMLEMARTTAKARYARLIEKDPQLPRIVRSDYIASYLGINDKTFGCLEKEFLPK